MKYWTLPVWITMVLALVAGPAGAQQIDSPYRFVEHGQTAGLFGAWIAAAQGPLGLGPEPSAGIGARYGIRVTGPFTAELEVMFTPTSREVIDTARIAGPDRVHISKGDTDVSLLIALANLRFDVTGPRTWHGLQPFVLLGGGVASDLQGTTRLDRELAADARFEFGSSFAGQVGAGAEFHFSRRWTARADARGVFWKLKNPPAFRVQQQQTEDEVVMPADQWESNGVISVGVSMRF